MIHSLLTFFGCLDKKFQTAFFALIILMVVSSFLEIISIALVIPFITLLYDPVNLYQLLNKISIPLISNFILDNPIINISILFFISIIFALIFKIFILLISTKFAYSLGEDINRKMFFKTLHMPYKNHLNSNSSEIVAGISSKSERVVSNVILPCVFMASSLILLIFIILTLSYINIKVTFFSILGFSLIYIFIAISVMSRLKLAGDEIAAHITNVVKSINHAIGDIRDVIINNSQKFYCDEFSHFNKSLRDAQCFATFSSMLPKIIVEAFALIIIISIILFLYKTDENFIDSLPVLAILAICAQKLLPLLQQIYNSWSMLSSGVSTLDDINKILKKSNFKGSKNLRNKLVFNKNILFKNVFFKYESSSTYNLKGINFTIDKGDIVGFVGKTGSGKSTVADLLMGLIYPSSGEIIIDGIKLNSKNSISWQSQIAHVSQNIFLKDAMIIENIAMNELNYDIDRDKVANVAKLAQLENVVDSLPEKYHTMVGERGIRLSGGERQRIAIARALYKNCDFLVFDEATSALDNNTERKIINTLKLFSSNLTIIIISHRKSSLQICNKIFKVDRNQIFKVK